MIEIPILLCAGGIGIGALGVAIYGMRRYLEIGKEIRELDLKHEISSYSKILEQLNGKKHIELSRNMRGHLTLIASDRDYPPNYINPTIVPPSPPHYQPPMFYPGMRVDPNDKYHATYKDS